MVGSQMKISVAIMTHMDRRQNAKALKAKLDTMWFEEVKLIYDTGIGEWDTGERAIQYGEGLVDWHIVLQDDAIIDDAFFENVYCALLNVPERSLVSFYLGKVKPYSDRVKLVFNRAIKVDASWISGSTLLWGVGIAIPTEQIPNVLVHARYYPRLLYDRRVGQYYLSKKMKVYYTTVSLVDHDYTLPSLTGHGNTKSPRVCHKFSNNKIIHYNSLVVAL
jgi:hypothetical protein